MRRLNKAHLKLRTFFIITPSYNQVSFIRETIRSVVSQKGAFHIKYCIIDGGSNDGTREVLSNLPNEIYWVSENDRGQTHAINKGLEWIQTQHPHKDDIVAYINSDDYYLPDAFASVAASAQRHEKANWFVGDAVIINETGEEIQRLVRIYKKMIRGILNPLLLLILNPVPQPATFLRYGALKEVGKFSESLRYTMDYEFWIRFWKQNGRPALINYALSVFRIHGLSKGGSQFIRQFQEEYLVASGFTSKKLVLALHRMHNFLIISIYKIIKS